MSAPTVLNNDLVAQAWVRSIPRVAALATPAPVGMTVPADATSWASTGFLQVMTTGGSPHPDFPYRQPVVTVFGWGVSLGGKKPPWDVAGRLVEYVLTACYDEHAVKRVLAVTAGGQTYPDAQIIEVNARSEPRPVPGDPAGYARYMLDVEIGWVAP